LDKDSIDLLKAKDIPRVINSQESLAIEKFNLSDEEIERFERLENLKESVKARSLES
jgi:hypothetical protein